MCEQAEGNQFTWSKQCLWLTPRMDQASGEVTQFYLRGRRLIFVERADNGLLLFWSQGIHNIAHKIFQRQNILTTLQRSPLPPIWLQPQQVPVENRRQFRYYESYLCPDWQKLPTGDKAKLLMSRQIVSNWQTAKGGPGEFWSYLKSLKLWTHL